MLSFATRNHAALLLLVSALAGAGDRLRAAGTDVGSASVPIVWKLDNMSSIGGQKPQVLGAPQFVDATAGGPALRFNGRTDGLVLPLNPIAGWTNFTIEVLFQPDANGPRAQRFLHIADRAGGRALIETRAADGRTWILDTYLARTKHGRTLRNRAQRHACERWAWVALVYDGKQMADYVNGVRQFQGRIAFPPMTTGSMSLGARLNRVYWFKGCLKEVRFHPTALAPEALQRVVEK
jgi:hypothetical protein